MKVIFYTQSSKLLSLLERMTLDDMDCSNNVVEVQKIISESDKQILLFIDYDLEEDDAATNLNTQLSSNEQIIRIFVSSEIPLKNLKKHQRSDVAADGYIRGPLDIEIINGVLNDFEVVNHVKENDIDEEGADAGNVDLTFIGIKKDDLLSQLKADDEDNEEDKVELENEKLSDDSLLFDIPSDDALNINEEEMFSSTELKMDTVVRNLLDDHNLNSSKVIDFNVDYNQSIQVKFDAVFGKVEDVQQKSEKLESIQDGFTASTSIEGLEDIHSSTQVENDLGISKVNIDFERESTSSLDLKVEQAEEADNSSDLDLNADMDLSLDLDLSLDSTPLNLSEGEQENIVNDDKESAMDLDLSIDNSTGLEIGEDSNIENEEVELGSIEFEDHVDSGGISFEDEEESVEKTSIMEEIEDSMKEATLVAAKIEDFVEEVTGEVDISQLVESNLEEEIKQDADLEFGAIMSDDETKIEEVEENEENEEGESNELEFCAKVDAQEIQENEEELDNLSFSIPNNSDSEEVVSVEEDLFSHVVDEAPLEEIQENIDEEIGFDPFGSEDEHSDDISNEIPEDNIIKEDIVEATVTENVAVSDDIFLDAEIEPDSEIEPEVETAIEDGFELSDEDITGVTEFADLSSLIEVLESQRTIEDVVDEAVEELAPMDFDDDTSLMEMDDEEALDQEKDNLFEENSTSSIREEVKVKEVEQVEENNEQEIIETEGISDFEEFTYATEINDFSDDDKVEEKTQIFMEKTELTSIDLTQVEKSAGDDLTYAEDDLVDEDIDNTLSTREFRPEQIQKEVSKTNIPFERTQISPSINQTHSLSQLDEDKLLSLQTTIREMRGEREELLERNQELRENEEMHRHDRLGVKVQNDELQIEINILKKRHAKESDKNHYQLKLLEEKKMILEEKTKNYKNEYERLEQKLRIDLTSVAARERELESQLEFLALDSEQQVKNRDSKILELKQKIDALEFNMENSSIREEQYKNDKIKVEERLSKMMMTLRGSIELLEEDFELDEDYLDDNFKV